MRLRRGAALALALGVVKSAVVTGQAVPAVHVRECLTARPLPRCDAFWVTELEAAIPMTPRRWHDPNVAWELGYMVNRSTGPAIGAALFAQVGHGDFDGVGVRQRTRFWFTDRTSLDVGPGVFVDGHRVGLSAMVALNTRLGAVTATWMTAPALETRGRASSLFLGVRAGGLPGLVLGGSAAALLGLGLLFVAD